MQACLRFSAASEPHCRAEHMPTAGRFGRPGSPSVVDGDSQSPVWVHLLFFPGNLHPLPFLSFSLGTEGGPCLPHMLLRILPDSESQRLLLLVSWELMLDQEKRPSVSLAKSHAILHVQCSASLAPIFGTSGISGQF